MKILLILLLVGVASGIHIGCEFGYSGWGSLGTIYYCIVVSVNYHTNTNQITGYSGTHLSGNSSSNVGLVYFPEGTNYCQNFNLTTFPVGFSSIFPNLIGLDFRGCAYDTLVGNELEEYPKLKWFRSLWGNLKRIPGNFFASNPDMVYIGFYDNNITNVGGGLLNNLQNLTEVDFRFNPCIHMRATNPSQILNLIEALENQCPDDTTPTTTTPPPITVTQGTTTQTPAPPSNPGRCYESCLEVFVCELKDDIGGINRKVTNLDSRVRTLEGFEGRVEELEVKNKMLEKENKEMRSEIKELTKKFEELEGKLGN